MSTTLISLLATLLPTADLSSTATELVYTGSLRQTDRDGGDEVKQFALYGLAEPAESGGFELSFLIEERGGGNWPWPERFGRSTLTLGDPIRLLYDFDGTLYPVAVPHPLFAEHEKLRPGNRWTREKLTYEVVKATKLDDRDCWQVEVDSNIGRHETLWIDKQSPLVLAAERRVFVGRGDEFRLRMNLESLRPLDAEELERVARPFATLVSLKQRLNRGAANTKPELSSAQLAHAAEVVERLEAEADGTPLAGLATVISRDVELQSRRAGDVAGLAKKHLGRTVEPLRLQRLDGGFVPAADLKGKVVVLHFWEYRGDRLDEPYGQVGYLDFLNNKRSKLGVEVIGVAVDERHGNPRQAATARRSVRKLQEFMNLSYEIAVDDGKLLAEFGDPRSVGAKLPLWIVVGADNKIVHYHAGFYSINPDEGLRQLDEAVIDALRVRAGGK